MSASAANAIATAQAPLRVEVLEGRDAFNALEREWNAALARGPRDEPMLRHEWIKAWVDNFAPGAPLRTFVVREGKELHAAVPLVETVERSADTCFVAMTTWAAPQNDHSQRGGVLVGRRGREALKLVWSELSEAEGWDRLRLRDLPHGAPEWMLRDLAEADGFPCGLWTSLRSPYLVLPPLAAPAKKQKGTAPDARYAAVEAKVDAKFRQNLRRRRRRLAEQGEVRYVIESGKDSAKLDEALADLFTIEASGWKGRSGTAIAQRPELVGFYTQIARDAARRGALSLGLLQAANKPIAAHLSIVHGPRYYLLKLGYDETLREFSPGQQLTGEAIHDACERGLSEFDFLGPDMDWKRDWEPALRTHTWLTIFRPTRKARLVYGARYTAWPIARTMLESVRRRGGG